MRSLTLGSLALVALLLLPGAQAGTQYDVGGKWFWAVTGTVRVSGLPGLGAHAVITVGSQSYNYTITFEPYGYVRLECADGAGELVVVGVAQPLEGCSLEVSGAFAIPRATITTLNLGELPGGLGDYVGSLRLTLEGSGVFPLA